MTDRLSNEFDLIKTFFRYLKNMGKTDYVKHCIILVDQEMVKKNHVI